MSRPDLAGTTLAGRYKVIGLIGEGGMGSVYLGEQIAMRRPTAIKVLHSGAEDADAIARFRRGARNAARIDHPNVCRVFEYGDPPGGLHFLAMEYIEGKSLHDVMSASPRGRIPIQRATDIVLQVVAALEAAHALGIVHRDLKPGNIMLTTAAAGTELVKVVDFDIAKAPTEPGDQEITEMHWWVGTPVYMSPEQLLQQPLDGRSDIYSLAIVYYRMLTGTLPFSATNHWAIMAQRLSDEPLGLAQGAPDLSFPDGLQEALDRGLRKEPTERWSSVTDFGDALRAAVDGMGFRGRAAQRTQPRGPEADISSQPTQKWHGIPSTPPSLVPQSSIPEGDEDTSIPPTELAKPSPSASSQGGATPTQRGRLATSDPPKRSPALLTAAALAVVALGGWGTLRFLDGRDRGLVEVDPVDRLLTLQREMLSLDLAGQDLPRGLVQAADSTAGSLFAQHEDDSELQALAAAVASRARGHLGDWEGALEWGFRAVARAPTESSYLDALTRAARETLLGTAESLRPGGAAVTDAVLQAADSLGDLVFRHAPELPADVRALAAAVRAAAHSGLGDARGAVTWAEAATSLAPADASYQVALAEYRAGAGSGPSVGGPVTGERVPRPSEDEGASARALFERQLAALEEELRSTGDGLADRRAAEIRDAARLVFDRSGQSSVLQARAASVHAQALMRLEDWSGAVTWGQRALALDPANPRHRSTTEEVYQRCLDEFRRRIVDSALDRPSGSVAERIYADAEASPSVRARAAYVAGFALYLDDDLPGGIDWLRRAVLLEPESPVYPRLLAAWEEAAR